MKELTKMNRRIFIQSVGATIALIATPVMAKTGPQWINFVDKMPKVGQKVALFTYFNENSSRNICTGRVLSEDESTIYMNRWGWRGYKIPDDVIYIKCAVSHSLDGFFRGEDVRSYNLIEDGRYLGDDIKRAKWINGERISYSHEAMLIPRHGRKKTRYIGRSAAYWTPIDEYIPKTLPTLPEPKPIKFVVENGTRYLIKD